MNERITLTFKPNVTATTMFLFVIKQLETYFRDNALFYGGVRGSVSNEKLNREVDIEINITVK